MCYIVYTQCTVPNMYKRHGKGRKNQRWWTFFYIFLVDCSDEIGWTNQDDARQEKRDMTENYQGFVNVIFCTQGY